MFGYLFALDQGYLPTGGLAGIAAQPAEEARVACNALAFDHVNTLDGL
jgi:hypothetical protein